MHRSPSRVDRRGELAYNLYMKRLTNQAVVDLIALSMEPQPILDAIETHKELSTLPGCDNSKKIVALLIKAYDNTYGDGTYAGSIKG